MLNAIAFLVTTNNIENTCDLVGDEGKFPKIIVIDDMII